MSQSSSSIAGDSLSCCSGRELYKRGSGIGKCRLPKGNEILLMIEEEDWQQVRQFMSTSQGRKACRKSDTSGLSVIGMVLGYHAPLDIVATLLELDPSASMKYDMFHAVPLHVASLNGVDIEIVNYLLDHDNNACAYSPDDDKRVALHHAVEYACNAIQRDGDSENDGIDVLRAIVSAGPSMLRKMDIHGHTPIDMTQMVKYEIRDENHPNYIKIHAIYSILRDANVRLYRKEKKRWERGEEVINDSGSLKDRTASTSISRMEELTLGVSIFTDPNSRNLITDSQTIRDSEDRGIKRKKKMFGGLFLWK